MRGMSIALVTGATRGIGRATAQRLAADGHQVAVGFGQDRAAAEALARDLGSIAVGGDLGDPATAEAIVDEVERELGPVGILVANAGVSTAPRRLEEIALAEWDRLQSVNLRAPFLLARRVLPGMIERGYGRIVLVSSVAAYTGGIIGAHYAASKAGLHGLAHSISQQAAPHGVIANVIAPALVESDMLPSDPDARAQLAQRLPVGRLGRPEEVADLIAAVVANAYLTNQSILLDGGWHPT
jgi:3-oxoacyl-[acyl-carrier protein] reductase